MAAERLRDRGAPPSAIRRADLARAFERAPALVERLAAEAPFPNVESVITRAREVLRAMSEPERIAVLDAHPRIGADPGMLSEASRREQGDDLGLRASSASVGSAQAAAVLRELRELNDAYERRFGFRFVVFVAGRSKSEILPILRERLRRSREDEMATGIGEFLAVARDRLSPS